MKVLLELLSDVSRLLESIDTLEEVRPDSRKSMVVLLETLHDEADRLLDTSDAMRAQSREAFMQRGLEAIAREQYEEARSIFEAASKAFPNDTEVHNHLGLIAWEMNDMEAAVAAYGKGMAAGFPDDGAVDWFDDTHRPFLRAMEGRALSLHRLERSEEALSLFENLADMNPAEYSGCRYLAGEIRHAMGDLEGAIGAYRLVPAEPAVLYNLGLAYFQQGNRAEAASVFIKAFSMNRYIGAHLLDRAPAADEEDIPGFLASSAYADEFVTACGHLWTSPACRHFLARVYDDPLVQTHLRRCVESVGSRVLSAGPAALTEDVVQSELDAHGRLGSIVRRVLEQLDS